MYSGTFHRPYLRHLHTGTGSRSSVVTSALSQVDRNAFDVMYKIVYLFWLCCYLLLLLYSIYCLCFVSGMKNTDITVMVDWALKSSYL